MKTLLIALTLAALAWSGTSGAYQYDQNGVRVAGTKNADDYQQEFDLSNLQHEQEMLEFEMRQRHQEIIDYNRNIRRQLERQNNWTRY